MMCIFDECLTISTRRHYLLNARSKNLEKTRLNTLATLLGMAMWV